MFNDAKIKQLHGIAIAHLHGAPAMHSYCHYA